MTTLCRLPAAVRWVALSAFVVACSTSTNSPDDATSPDLVFEDQLAPGDLETDTWTPNCQALPALPVAHSELPGFTGAEDFAFDGQGRVVSVDSDGSLVRQTIDASKQLWVPAIGADAAGIRFLPGGDLLVNAVSLGALLRVTPEGGYGTVLSGLRYPNGLEVDLEGFAYVSEHDAGRIRRVDPDSGDFSIIAEGLFNPNGLTFSPDYQTLYCGSFGGGLIYAVDRGPDGSWEAPRLFARTPQAPLDECADKALGDACLSLGGLEGLCEDFGGALLCAGRSPCEGKQEGDDCQLWGSAGTCLDLEGLLDCIPISGCEGRAEGDDCDAWGMPGVCTWNGLLLECVQVGPCHQKEAGDLCDAWGLPGVCKDFGGYLDCEALPPCQGLLPGDPCQAWEGPGRCEGGHGGLDCVPVPPCEGKLAGDQCLQFGQNGRCQDFEGGLECVPLAPCEGLEPGSPCEDWGSFGVCVPLGEDEAQCLSLLPCEGKAAGDACGDDLVPFEENAPKEGWGGSRCEDHGGFLVCLYQDPCQGKNPGAACPAYGYPGQCLDLGWGLTCQQVYPCDGKDPGVVCEVGELSGLCLEAQGVVDCHLPELCLGLRAGDPCEVWGQDGLCNLVDQHLLCLPEGGTGSYGGLDGIGVDACGNLYVTEYVVGLIWRFPPEGSQDASLAQLVLETGSSWIPNMHWGSGLGGWQEDVLYVMDRDLGRLFALEVGVPGKVRPFPGSGSLP